MATRLATARNFITVTAVPQNDNSDGLKNENMESHNDGSTGDAQCTTQLTPVALHHVNLSQVSQFDWVSFCARILVVSSSLYREKPSISTEENYPPNWNKRRCECDWCGSIGIVRFKRFTNSRRRIDFVEWPARKWPTSHGSRWVGKLARERARSFLIPANDRISFELSSPTSRRRSSSRIAEWRSAALYHGFRQTS